MGPHPDQPERHAGDRRHREITEDGVVTTDGRAHPADVIIYGTGFEASRFLTPMRVVGRDGADLHDQWAGDASAYLGMTVPGFPNFFLLYGPNTNVVVSGSVIFFSECEMRYVMGCLRLLLEQGATTIECRPEVHAEYRRHTDEANRRMAWGASTVNSWYKSASGRVTQNWPSTSLEFWQRTRHPDPDDYVITRSQQKERALCPSPMWTPAERWPTSTSRTGSGST